MLHPTKRQSEILRAVKLYGTCPVGELARELNVSDETIRRDVRLLVEEGLVIKVHGAIVAPDHLREDPFQLRLQEHRAEKIRIAARAAALVGHGDSVMLDTGSTTAYVAQSLVEHRNLFAVTNSVEVARSLANQNGNRVYMAGGEIRADDGAAFGESANEFASRFQVDKGFLSIAAISGTEGFMDNELWEADYSRVVIRQAAKVIVVADHSKFDRRAFVKVCGFDEVDTLITSELPPTAVRLELDAAGVEVIVA
ncbi:MAG: DeoR/GlpR family DNA-binding transcription regulator [Rhodospirillales bacterium]